MMCRSKLRCSMGWAYRWTVFQRCRFRRAVGHWTRCQVVVMVVVMVIQVMVMVKAFDLVFAVRFRRAVGRWTASRRMS